MAAIGVPRARRAILDSGAILAIAAGDAAARAALVRARREGYSVVIPTPVVAQVHRGGRQRAQTDRVFKAVDALVPTSVQTAMLAGELLAASGGNDAVDAIVAAEAMFGAPAIILTSDAADIRRLLGSQPDGVRVAVVAV